MKTVLEYKKKTEEKRKQKNQEVELTNDAEI
jgi:hypothetical protein